MASGFKDADAPSDKNDIEVSVHFPGSPALKFYYDASSNTTVQEENGTCVVHWFPFLRAASESAQQHAKDTNIACMQLQQRKVDVQVPFATCTAPKLKCQRPKGHISVTIPLLTNTCLIPRGSPLHAWGDSTAPSQRGSQPTKGLGNAAPSQRGSQPTRVRLKLWHECSSNEKPDCVHTGRSVLIYRYMCVLANLYVPCLRGEVNCFVTSFPPQSPRSVGRPIQVAVMSWDKVSP